MKIFLIGLLIMGYMLKRNWNGIKYFLKGNEIKIEIEDRIVANHWSLTKSEIEAFSYVFKKNFISEKVVTWQDKCEAQKDYHCRLLSHYYEVTGNNDLSIQFALIGCEAKDAHSCVAVYKNPKFSRGHPKYFEVLDAIISVCESDAAISEIDQMACDIYRK